ncbi:MAG: glutamate--tRNA ligase [Thermodesulfobacteriota bacterium]|nr:glutamate--tRNA ligase [Thermodesulfobacteriota bacterium]
MSNIVTRFPPSPTGYLHVGGARTALFNWLYARHMKGRFVLRIEDTDTKRSTQASVDAIFEALEWLGIDWDDGPYFQSKRLDVYKTYVQQLLDSGHAYYCICSQEKIDAMRKEAMAAGGKPKYDGTCRDRDLAKTANAVIRFKAPVTGSTIVKDIIKGNIVFQNSEQDDFIICRSDGTPTYNFVVVVDDITMGINTVIRGDDHLNNTPRQIMLYNALKSPLPDFGHVPMVLGKDRTRLSKRHGAMSVTAYRDMGYLPDALINYLVRLGWSYGDQEFFSRDELIEKFTLENIGKSPGIFDQEKLLALNADHIKAASPRNLSAHLLPFLKERGCMAEQGDFLDSVIRTLNTRSKTLIDMADGALFYYTKSISYEEKAAQKHLKPACLSALQLLINQFESLDTFSEKALENIFKKVMDNTGLKLGKIAQPVRVALTGKTVSPGIFEIIEVLGKKQVILRLQNAVQFIKDREG